MKAASRQVAPVGGLRLAATAAGIRYRNRPDLVLMEFSPDTRVSALFTRNAFVAAPVLLAREHLDSLAPGPGCLLINAGNANAGTGDAGLAAARECCRLTADATGVEISNVLPFSTGVIGEQLPLKAFARALPRLAKNLAPAHWPEAAAGILTTDTRAKLTGRRVVAGKRHFQITGMAKGSGMIKPDMATLLAFAATDAPLSHAQLHRLHRRAVAASFNAITVDGDTSSNDASVLLATGAAGGPRLTAGSPEFAALGSALMELYAELAEQLVRDAEGAGKFIRIEVTGGRTPRECARVAYSVAQSPLVKTALGASDPNWGRILAAVGRTGVKDLDMARVTLHLGGTPVYAGGQPVADYREAQGRRALAGTDILVRIHLGRGRAEHCLLTSDLTQGYVAINANYRS